MITQTETVRLVYQLPADPYNQLGGNKPVVVAGEVRLRIAAPQEARHDQWQARLQPQQEIAMARITLTQLQYDVLDGLRYSDDSTPADLLEWEMTPRSGATLETVKRAVAQLVRKGFARLSGQRANITRLGECALDLIASQEELADIQKRFDQLQARRAAK